MQLKYKHITQKEYEFLCSLYDYIKLKHASFDEIEDGDIINIKKGDVTEFIKDRTRLYRETWIMEPLRDFLNKKAGYCYIEED